MKPDPTKAAALLAEILDIKWWVHPDISKGDFILKLAPVLGHLRGYELGQGSDQVPLSRLRRAGREAVAGCT